ncbi:hypothetical protein SAMN05216428_102437 [Nitrosospira sp. Nsp11]|uniref:hypothetical protein n=1 Tax=Nitrosospira sp. Nsp11 TaxID=1855338 RepID=UPI0009110046|nr:hypothetical protein [Nitrosospira sp. Nsp11]SHL44835.1 hypothetical protein SAMN05216428_102437 [Nitrosospira sp. Nsp11]
MSKTGQNIAIAGAVAVGAFMLLKSSGGIAAPFRRVLGIGNQTGNPVTGYDKVTEILNQALPAQPGYAWKYYSDGTSISPEGNYYHNGALVWSPGG